MNKESFRQEREFGVLEISEQSAQLGSLLLYASLGNREKIEEIIESSRKIEDSFIAYESVRKGFRAGFIVGNVYNQSQKLPFTGLEPYTVGSELSPKEVVGFEVSEGLRLMKIFSRRGSKYEYLKTLMKEKSNPRIMRELSEIYGGLIARFRAIGDSEKSQFRYETYSRVKTLPDIVYELNGRDLSQKMFIPQASQNLFYATRVTLSDDEFKGYMLLVKMGRFGHPLIREAVRRLD